MIYSLIYKNVDSIDGASLDAADAGQATAAGNVGGLGTPGGNGADTGDDNFYRAVQPVRRTSTGGISIKDAILLPGIRAISKEIDQDLFLTGGQVNIRVNIQVNKVNELGLDPCHGDACGGQPGLECLDAEG